MKKIFSIILAFSISASAVAAADIDAGYASVTNNMSVRGDAGEYNSGKSITMLLLKNEADIHDYTYDQIGYVEQGTVEADGTYDFDFKFTGDVEDYKLLMNIAGENVTDTVQKAVAKADFFDVSLKIEKYTDTAKAIAEIENRYGLSLAEYQLIMTFYDGDNKMLGVKLDDVGTITDKTASDSLDAEIPEGTEFIKAMIWDSAETMIPLCNSETRGKERIVCWGDSLTQGAAGQYNLDGTTLASAVTFPKVLAELSGREVVNKGIGGQGATQIAVRQGGVKLLTTSEVKIPASATPVKVELTTSNGIAIVDNPYDMGLSRCYISDIEGKLECIDNVFYFTRKVTGNAYTAPVGTQIVSADALEYNDGIAVIWIGTNGGWVKQGSDWFDFKAYMEICDGMIAELENKNEEYVIVGLTAGSTETRGSMENILSEKYGNRFINMREYLSNDETLYEKYGVTLTDADRETMAKGGVPGTILHDGPHFYSVGYKMIGDKIYNHMVEIGLLNK